MKKIIVLLILFLSSCRGEVKTFEEYQDSYQVQVRIDTLYDMTPLERGLQFFGESEKPGGNSVIDDIVQVIDPQGNQETPWCSGFLNQCTMSTGYESSNSLAARSWIKVGEDVTKSPKPGDIAVLWRVSPDSWQGHVAFFVKYNHNDSKVLLYGGNQGNSTTFMWYNASKILSIRRLKKIKCNAVSNEASVNLINLKYENYENFK